MSAFGIDIQVGVVVVGAITGLTYGVLAAGLVLIFRATRVINFAHGQIGAFGGAIFLKLIVDYDWNYLLALAAVCVVGGAVGAVVELGVIRRLFEAPRLILLVATIGVSQVLFFLGLLFTLDGNVPLDLTPINRQLEIGGVRLLGEHFLVIAVVPALVVTLALFLERTPAGLAIRGAAENADAAKLAGVDVKRVSTLVWVLAGVLSTITAVLVGPLRGAALGVFAGAAVGPSLLLRALTAALVGRLVSLPLALVGGVAVGVVEALVFANASSDPGLADALFFVAVVVLLLVRGGARQVAGTDGGSWSTSPRTAPIPERLRGLWWVRHLPHLGAGGALLFAIVLPVVFATAEQQYLFSRVAIYAMIALSVTVLTGWNGQLSLGQFAFVGIGAFVTAALVARSVPFGFAVVWATGAGVVAALIVGFPALRIRGLLLAITTLAFALAAKGWLFPRLTGDSAAVFVPRGELFGVDLANERTYYYLCLAVLAAVTFITSRLRASGLGRTLIAVRDNDRNAAAFTVSPTLARLSAFAISGGIASLAGGMLAGAAVQFNVSDFGPDESLRIVALTIIGGLGSVMGSVLGAVYVLGVPAMFNDTQQVRLLTSGAGLLVLLLYFPGGLAALVHRARDALLSAVDARHTGTADAVDAVAARPQQLTVRERPIVDTPEHIPALNTIDVTVQFGGLVALDAVSVRVEAGEIIGLIGTNGAGKSTLMNAISGFVPAAGAVELSGVDISGMSPAGRAASGLGRTFQEARLFPDLTVRETLQVALEARERSELVPSMLSLPPSRAAERHKRAESEELIAFLGLGRYADAFVSNLSTGTRRICELACLLALDARVLLLDEPTAGVAQREAEAFGPLIVRIRKEMNATVLVIEHDMPLVFSLSDRVYCLSAGRVIAEGTPDEVRADVDVIASYLGTDDRAILRSGVAAGPA